MNGDLNRGIRNASRVGLAIGLVAAGGVALIATGRPFAGLVAVAIAVLALWLAYMLDRRTKSAEAGRMEQAFQDECARVMAEELDAAKRRHPAGKGLIEGEWR